MSSIVRSDGFDPTIFRTVSIISYYNLKGLDGLSNNSIDYCCLLKTKNLKTLESIFKIFEKLFIYFGILEKFN